MDATRFKHKPLEQANTSIRLIKVLSQTSGDALISCNIWHADLSVDYCCLSYVWGPEGDEKPILLGGKSFNVRSNLWNFLDIAQRKYTNVALWIDAICINQDDDQEKSHQVRMMGRIYSEARLVYIWLGREKFPQGALERVQAHTKNHAYIHIDLYNDTDTLDELTPCSLCEKEAKQIAFLCNDAYWTRAWIVQEVLLARNKCVLHGEQAIIWADYENIWRSTIYPFNDSLDQPRGLDATINRSFATSLHSGVQRIRTLHETPLWYLLEQYPDSQCSKFHDRIYSLLGLAQEGVSFPVDYKINREALFLQTLKSSPQSCICKMSGLLKALYSSGQEKQFLRMLKEDYVSKATISSSGFFEITLQWAVNFRRARVGWVNIDQKDGEHKAAVNLTTCALFPREADLIICGIPEKRQWRCVGISNPHSMVGKEISSEITLSMCTRRSKWRALLSERALVALAIVSRVSDELVRDKSQSDDSGHDCDDVATRAAYRFVDLSEDITT